MAESSIINKKEQKKFSENHILLLFWSMSIHLTVWTYYLIQFLRLKVWTKHWCRSFKVVLDENYHIYRQFCFCDINETRETSCSNLRMLNSFIHVIIYTVWLTKTYKWFSRKNDPSITNNSSSWILLLNIFYLTLHVLINILLDTFLFPATWNNDII